MTPRTPRRRVDGVLLLDKPAGITSNVALQRAKRLYAAEKAGHTGTLDPLASGLLPICFGEATKFAQSMLDARKAYVATIRFGVATTTGDAEGEPTATSRVDFDRAALEAALARFVGTIEQVPPRHAALKYRGRAYYDYARAGVDIPRAARSVDIESLDLLAWTPPDAIVAVACGKGTYVRALAEDIGAALATCAHVAALRRTRSGAFRVEQASTFATIEAMHDDERLALLLDPDAPLADVPVLRVDAAAAQSLREGKAVGVGDAAPGRYRGYADSRFIGLLEVAGDRIRPLRLTRSG
jgi:tRNA pseudouridine55 synthase